MRFGTRNIRSLCWAGSLKTVSSEMAIQEVRWDEGGNQPPNNYTFSMAM
jgi:hypothetical protein